QRSRECQRRDRPCPACHVPRLGGHVSHGAQPHSNEGVAGMLSRKAIIGVFVALTLTVGGAAACSSSSKSSSSGGGGGGSAQAQANIEALLKPPTSINITQPLTKKPPTGKKVCLSQSSEPVTLETNKGFADAAAAVGW